MRIIWEIEILQVNNRGWGLKRMVRGGCSKIVNVGFCNIYYIY